LENNVGIGRGRLAVTVLVLLIAILADAVVSANGVEAGRMLTTGVGTFKTFVDVLALAIDLSEAGVADAVVTTKGVSAVAVRRAVVDVLFAFVDIITGDHTIATESLLAFALVFAVGKDQAVGIGMAVDFSGFALVDGLAVLAITNEAFLALASKGARKIHAVSIRRAVVLSSGALIDILADISDLDESLLAHALITTIGVDAGSMDITNSQTFRALVDVGTGMTVSAVARLALTAVCSALRQVNTIRILRTIVGTIQALVDVEDFDLSLLSTKRLQMRITTEIGSVRNIVQSRSLSSHIPGDINGNVDLAGTRIFDGPTRLLVVGSSLAADLVIKWRLQGEGKRNVNFGLGGHSFLVAEGSPLSRFGRACALITGAFAVMVDHPGLTTVVNNLGLTGVGVQSSTRVGNDGVAGKRSNFWFSVTSFTED